MLLSMYTARNLPSYAYTLTQLTIPFIPWLITVYDAKGFRTYTNAV